MNSELSVLDTEGLPEGLSRGKRSWLFPPLAENRKEERTNSVFLACMANVDEFGAALLKSIGQRAGVRTKIETYIEVSFEKTESEISRRHDGLIVVKSGKTVWRALFESKIGNDNLDQKQIEDCIEVARKNGIDAVITISNQFAAEPNHHPLPIKPNKRLKKDVELYHWSWMYVLTEANLLFSTEKVEDSDQFYILRELNRFLLHPSAGVKGFDTMPGAWAELNKKISSGGAFTKSSSEAQDVVSAWHQEIRDLSFIFSRLLRVHVKDKLPRAHIADKAVRFNQDLEKLVESRILTASLVIPSAAAPLDVVVDLGHRTVSASIKLKAPEHRKSTEARLNWLLRQIEKAPEENIYIRFCWYGGGTRTQNDLASLRLDPSLPQKEKPDMQLASFELCMVTRLGANFTKSRKFIEEFERVVPEFYKQVVQGVKAWQSPAPKMAINRQSSDDVTTVALAAEVESDVNEN